VRAQAKEIVIKTYPGNRSFQADAIKMAEKGYFPTSQIWKQGQWGGGAYILAVLAIFLFGLGILILGYMLIVKPQGALTVTYQLRAPVVDEKTCPSCAERIKSAALVCHFCGHQFTPAEVQAAIAHAERNAESVYRGHSSTTAATNTAAFIGGVAILLIVMLSIGRWTLLGPQRQQSEGVNDTATPQADADSSVRADRTAVVAPLQDVNKLNPPSDIKAVQNRLLELGFLAGPAGGVWGTKSRMALRAFKIANGLAADDKWDDLASGRLYSTQAARSPLPLATTGK
jgi:Uncharacterised protein family UPF0547/Putative peptidoglycan binding domain